MPDTPYPLPRAPRQSDILAGDGGTTYGPFAFRIFDIADVAVYTRAAGSADPWAAAAFTAAKATTPTPLELDDFTITFDAAIDDTTEFVVVSERLHERTAAITRGGTLSGQMMEKELSKQGSVLQEHRRDIDRAVKVDYGADGQALPAPEADHALGWVDGKLANVPNGGAALDDAVAAAQAAQAGAETAQAGTAADAATADTKATAAANSALDAQAARDATLAAKAKDFASVALLLASMTLGYAYPATTPIAAGDQVKGGVFDYAVAASGATDHDVTTASGVKLYVNPNADGSYSAAAFGVVADWITDDTAALHKCFDRAFPLHASVQIPKGRTRVTSGYELTDDYGDIVLRGAGSSRFWNFTDNHEGSIIGLDSTDTGSFFVKVNGRAHVQARDCDFYCNQFVQDRPFFWFYGSDYKQFTYDNVCFSAVEEPFVFESTAAMQSSSLNNVQFYNSGTLHSRDVGASAINTILTLTDVNHEGTVPENTDKIVCNLHNFRHVRAKNFLLEGALPSAGWTVLKQDNTYNPAYAKPLNFIANGMWIEFAGTYPADNVLHFIGGKAIIDGLNDVFTGSHKVKLDSQAHLHLRATARGNSGVTLASFFTFVDTDSMVFLEDTMSTGTDEFDTFQHRQIMHRRSHIMNSTSQQLRSAVFGNGRMTSMYKWAGGYADDDGVTIAAYSGCTWNPSTDATWGRKLVVVPSGNVISWQITITTKGRLVAGDQVGVAMLVKLPTWTAGNILVGWANYDTYTIKSFDSSYSGQTVLIRNVKRMITSNANFALAITVSGVSGLSGNVEIGAMEFFTGASGELPAEIWPSYPTKVRTFATVAPTTGTWAAGDQVDNSAPAAGGAPGWRCTAAGTPGTWKALANLAA